MFKNDHSTFIIIISGLNQGICPWVHRLRLLMTNTSSIWDGLKSVCDFEPSKIKCFLGDFQFYWFWDMISYDPSLTSVWLFNHEFVTLWPFGLRESIFLTKCGYFWIKIVIKHSRKFVNCFIGMFPSIFWPFLCLGYFSIKYPSSIFMTKYSRSWQPGWMLAAQNIWGCNRPEYGGLKKIKWLKVEIFFISW